MRGPASILVQQAHHLALHAPSLQHRGRPRLQHRCQAAGPDKGFGVLEWAGSLVPQGVLKEGRSARKCLIVFNKQDYDVPSLTGAKGTWRTIWLTFMKELAPQTPEGAYERPSYKFSFKQTQALQADSGRYALYVGNACPWCHRALLTLVLRGLEPHVTVINCTDDPERASRGGWVFDQPEPVFGASDLRGVYSRAEPGFSGRCTAPLLLDRRSRRIISNESEDIVRLLNGLHLPGCPDTDLRGPADQLPAIQQLCDTIYNTVNNGVYKSGFCTSQQAYERAQSELYRTLDGLEGRLSKHRFLLGDKFTQADLWLFPTAVRFDAVYATLFKCTRRRIRDYPHIQAWLKDVWRLSVSERSSKVGETFSLQDARQSYFGSLFPLNPGGIVPLGPTESDLGLGQDPKRGGTKASEVFHARTSSPQAVPA